MSLQDELYKETILDHYHCPRNFGSINSASLKLEGLNPLCGDELTLYLKLNNDIIEDIKVEAKGCSISTASSSMMTEAVKGLSLDKAINIASEFKQMMLNKNEITVFDETNDDLNALAGVKKYPVRIKCALLAWNTLLQCIEGNNTENDNLKNSKE